MMTKVFYLIEPKPELLDLLSNVVNGEPVAGELLRQQLWINEEGGLTRGREWIDQEQEVRVKLRFLLYAKWNYSETSFAEILFPGREIKIEQFDSYWKIARISVGGISSLAERMVPKDLIRDVQKTGVPVVDAWIDSLVRDLEPDS